ncbi:hypothetical protein C2I06_14280 [Niallia circulans]|nr:hypothetical protein [Niallia circulans]AYV67941.1 hypothetical protein C2I06_14280 [Niallia circulans]AYV73684.1 hypothetical protein C2H98_20140 [Niallia circulans]
MKQKNNDEILIKQSIVVSDQNYFLPETGNIWKGLFFGMLISIPLWVSFFGWLRIFLTLVGI